MLIDQSEWVELYQNVGGKGIGAHWCVRSLGEEVQGTTRLLGSAALLQGLTDLDSSLLDLDQLLFCAEAALRCG